MAVKRTIWTAHGLRQGFGPTGPWLIGRLQLLKRLLLLARNGIDRGDV